MLDIKRYLTLVKALHFKIDKNQFSKYLFIKSKLIIAIKISIYLFIIL